MALLRMRSAILLSCFLASLHAISGDAAAQRQGQNRGRTTQAPAQRQPATRRPAAADAQTRPANSSAQRPAQAPAFENADAETRAAFLKLIGADWIWSPAHPKDEVPVGDCYFRKTFPAQNAELAQVHIACDNQYELYVNGRLAGSGNDWRKMDVHDITKLLNRGKNVIAIKATNADPGAAGLVARVIVKEKGGTFESYSTD